MAAQDEEPDDGDPDALYMQLELPEQAADLLSLSARILALHAPGCGIPEPPDPGKAAVVCVLYRYGFCGEDLDYRKAHWLPLRGPGEGHSSSVAGQPDLPPAHIIADDRTATVLWNPSVTLPQALFYLQQIGIAQMGMQPEALRNQFKRTIPPLSRVESGRVGSEPTRWRFSEVLRAFGIQARDVYPNP